MDPTLPGPPPAPAPAPPPRPGAALTFFAALLVLVWPDVLAQTSSPTLGLAWGELFAILLPAVVAAAGSNLRPLRYLGLDRARALPVILGALLGGAGFLAASGVMIAWVAVLPRSILDAVPDVARIFEGGRVHQLVVALSAVLLAPLCEEVAFRGFVQRTLARALPPAVAIGLGALLFAMRHLDPVRLPALVLLGALFGWVAWRSGSLWPAIAAHVANNAIASAVALLGPEGAGPDRPALAEALWPLVLGGAALALLAAAFRRATPSPPAPGAAVALRDPADPSTRFRLDRVPGALLVAALVGLAALSALALLSPRWENPIGP